MRLRLALTMRVVEAQHYIERRDCLSHDWGMFLAAALPEAAWCAIPNLGARSMRMMEAFGVNGLILTGGDDWGTHPERDATEEALLRWALSQGIPVLGVCRGAQAINLLFGGMLVEGKEGSHVAVRHPVISCAQVAQVEVNSFHRLVIPGNGLGSGLKVSGWAPDGTVEAYRLPSQHVAGVMWHPERECISNAYDVSLMRALFAKELK